MSLYNFKLVGIMNGEYESYVSLINATGEIVTLQMNEELSPGIRLVDLRPGKAIFEKGDDSFLVINFKVSCELISTQVDLRFGVHWQLGVLQSVFDL